MNYKKYMKIKARKKEKAAKKKEIENFTSTAFASINALYENLFQKEFDKQFEEDKEFLRNYFGGVDASTTYIKTALDNLSIIYAFVIFLQDLLQEEEEESGREYVVITYGFFTCFFILLIRKNLAVMCEYLLQTSDQRKTLSLEEGRDLFIRLWKKELDEIEDDFLSNYSYDAVADLPYQNHIADYFETSFYLEENDQTIENIMKGVVDTVSFSYTTFSARFQATHLMDWDHFETNHQPPEGDNNEF